MADDTYIPRLLQWWRSGRLGISKKGCQYYGFSWSYKSWTVKQKSLHRLPHVLFKWNISTHFVIIFGLKAKFKYVYKGINVTTLNLFVFPHWRWRYGRECKRSCKCFAGRGFDIRRELLMAVINPYPTAFPYGNGMVLHFYQQQESSTTKTVHKVINKRLKAYV